MYLVAISPDSDAMDWRPPVSIHPEFSGKNIGMVAFHHSKGLQQGLDLYYTAGRWTLYKVPEAPNEYS